MEGDTSSHVPSRRVSHEVEDVPDDNYFMGESSGARDDEDVGVDGSLVHVDDDYEMIHAHDPSQNTC